ncbi:MAG: hypothetical protein JWM96_943 [Alphaproteobacteria bacterium]|nr:hypothetical protein [Alphaproteobacteria bacterium]
MKKALYIFLGLIGALVLLVLLVPALVDLNKYKPQIQQKAMEATGREIVINGDIRLSLLPAPYARLTDVAITNPEGAMSREFASVKAIDVGVALIPLLSKKIQVTHITITEPAINLEVMADGKNNWQFTPAPDAAEEEKAEETETASDQLSVDDFTIENGTIRYIDTPKRTQDTIGPITGKFTLASLQGPVTGNGTITVLDKLPVAFEGTIDNLPREADGVIPFKLALTILNDAGRADLNGQIQKGKTMSAKAETAIGINDLPKILGAISEDGVAPTLPPFLRGKNAVNGLLEYKNDQARINNLVLRAGEAEISGSFLADLKTKKSITIDLKNVVLPPDMAQQVAPAADAKENKEPKTDTLAQSLEKNFASATDFLETELPLSPLNLVVTAAQLPLPGQPMMRDVRIAISSGAKGMTIQNIEAKLPGNTSVQLQGELPIRQDGKIANAMIKAKITTQNFQAAMGKEGTPLATPISVQTTLNLSRENLRLDPFQVSQNKQSVQGDIVYTPHADEALVIALKGSALNVDAFIGKPGDTAPTPAEPAPPVQAAIPGGATGPAVVPADPLAVLDGFKARISANLESITYHDKTAKNVSIQSNISGNAMQLQQANIGDLGGMVLTGNGKIDRLSPLGGANFVLHGTTPDLSGTLKALGNEKAKNLGASQFDAQIDGDANNLKIGLNGTIDQGKIAVNGTASNLSNSPEFIGNVDIAHPETATIVRNFAGLTPNVDLGAFALRTNLTYGKNTFKAKDLDLKLGSAGALQGNVNLIFDRDTKTIDANIHGDKLALAALMGDDTQTSAAAVDTTQPKQTDEGWSKEPIDLSFLRNTAGMANVEIGELLYKKFVVNGFGATINFENGNLNMRRLKGNLFNASPFNINGQLAPGAEGQAHRGDFTIGINNADAAKLFIALGSKPFNRGTLDLTQKFNFNGASPFEIINSLNGDGEIRITGGVVNGIDLDGLAAKLDRPNSLSDFAAIVEQARAGGETAISDVTMPVEIRNGIVNVRDTVIRTQKTAMDVKGTIPLPTKQVDLAGTITFVEQRNLPPLTLFIRGPMNDPKKSFDTGSFTNFFAQKATEKLQEKVQEKLGKLLGVPSPAPAAAPAQTPAAPATDAPPANAAGVAPITPPTAPTPPAAPAPQAVKPEDALKQLGGQMLQNLLGGGK